MPYRVPAKPTASPPSTWSEVKERIGGWMCRIGTWLCRMDFHKWEVDGKYVDWPLGTCRRCSSPGMFIFGTWARLPLNKK